ncbi:MAG: Gfo/Idh/MocA family oxidoreductase [Kiritimatiellae bacterium]|nr:Gfo/Idh/MocA family oxidoreductase [Kiritimatiellia bacterium]
MNHLKAKTPVEIIIIGGGSRGSVYASYAKAHPERATIVGVAEPRDAWRNKLVQAHGIPGCNIALDWREFLNKPKCADAVVIATQDKLHLEPTVALARMGYHILLEKPMAPNPADCRSIVEAAQAAGVIFAVCHVLRYTAHTQRLKQLITSNLIGEVINLQSLEPVGYWHQAHSFVRGNWRRTDESSSMLLAKCCHDLDWIRYIMGQPCRAVHSFGSLKHFRSTEQPADAADRCLECPCEPQCPYSALKIYLPRVERGERGWPLDVLTPDVSKERVMEALQTGPYGRCVYACDNDVVDHQVVNMQFESGSTASLTMTAFTEANHRQVRIFGTLGELISDGRTIRHFDFLTDTWSVLSTASGDSSIRGGHGGGDYALMRAFVDAVHHNNQSLLLSGASESLETHAMVFAAEQARLEGVVVPLYG